MEIEISTKKNKIRVLHIGLSSHLGGIETYLRKITKYVDRDSFQFDFLIYKGTEPCFYEELLEYGCNFYTVTTRKENYAKSIKELNNIFTKEKFDVVHCHLNSLSCIDSVLIALKNKYKVIVHSRNAGCLKSFKSRIMHKINYYRLPKEKITLVAVSDFAGEWMFGKNSKVIVLNNGLETKEYCFSDELRNKIRAELGIQDETVIVHTGAFRTQKNHIKIINIFTEYEKMNPKSVLLLVGEGELKKDIEKQAMILGIADKVVFLGQRSDMQAILSAGDYFLFPSLYEGFPNALLEAETSGLCCFVSDTITREVFVNNLCNMLSINLSAKEWANQMIKYPQMMERYKYEKIIRDKGLGIEQEIKNLCELYKKIN